MLTFADDMKADMCSGAIGREVRREMDGRLLVTGCIHGEGYRYLQREWRMEIFDERKRRRRTLKRDKAQHYLSKHDDGFCIFCSWKCDNVLRNQSLDLSKSIRTKRCVEDNVLIRSWTNGLVYRSTSIAQLVVRSSSK